MQKCHAKESHAMFFSQFTPNGLLTASGYLRKRVVPRFSLLRHRIRANWVLRGVSKGSIVKSVLFGVPGYELARVAGVCVTIFIMLTTPSSAEDRTISMYNIHTQETITVTFKRNGKYVLEGLQQLNHFMRDWRRNQETKMDPALIDIIWELHEELGSKVPVHLICGYRSPATNEMLRRTSGGQAKNSRHITGQAADLVFPDVPLKQLRYAGLAKERGGVGFYPTSGLPFVHVDTGNVRHWPGISRTELALVFPNGHSRHVPDDGRPLTPADSRIALAKWHAAGNELPWVVTHKQASGTMLANLTPTDKPVLQQASLTLPEEDPAEAPEAKPAALSQAKPAAAPPTPEAPSAHVKELETKIQEEGEEQDDDMELEPIPTNLLLVDKSLSYLEMSDEQARPQVFPKIGFLMSSPNALAAEQFDQGLQIEALYEANVFKGAAVAFIRQRRMSVVASAEAHNAAATR
jgi:uncharacterized protein YcbK (DUF882 family)